MSVELGGETLTHPPSPVQEGYWGQMMFVTIGTVAFLLFLFVMEFSHWDASKRDQPPDAR